MRTITPKRVPLVYIAGPYRPTPSQIKASRTSGVDDDPENIARDWRDYNIAAAHEAGRAVVAAGGMPLTPHKCTEGFDGLIPDDEFIARDIRTYLVRCDALWAIDGWRESVGALCEVLYAARIDMPVLFTADEMRRFVAHPTIFPQDRGPVWKRCDALKINLPAMLAERGVAVAQ